MWSPADLVPRGILTLWMAVRSEGVLAGHWLVSSRSSESRGPWKPVSWRAARAASDGCSCWNAEARGGVGP